MPLPDPPADLTIRPARPDEADAVARVRARCYKAAHADEKGIRDRIGQDTTDLAAGDVLLAEKPGRGAMATVTSLRLEMNVRGAVLPTQGIAWVGTVHDARRSGGLASATMWKAIELGRDRGQVLSALMPFRASYYEHFGYGLCERRALWTIPIPTLPSLPRGEEHTFRLIEPDDADTLKKVAALRRRQFESAATGHGDAYFPHADPAADLARDLADDGYLFADLDPDSGEPRGAVYVSAGGDYGDRRLRATRTIHTDVAGLLRQLQFLGTMRDQYGRVELATPADVPLERLLRETQLPHRGVEHAYATCEVANRNQVRVLDHLKLMNAMPWPDAAGKGKAVIAVAESEGHESRFALDVADGRCEATASEATAAFSCADKIWASIALGEITASFAAAAGLATGDAAAIALLDGLSRGPLPFCRERF